MLRPGLLLTSVLISVLIGVTVAACGSGGSGAHHTGTPAYLTVGTGRAAVISALDKKLCRGHIPVIEDVDPYWVGLCRDRTTFEEPVFFMVFNTADEMRVYLDRFESCRSEATYVRGPSWFAMTVAPGDADTLEHAGATRFACT